MLIPSGAAWKKFFAMARVERAKVWAGRVISGWLKGRAILRESGPPNRAPAA